MRTARHSATVQQAPAANRVVSRRSVSAAANRRGAPARAASASLAASPFMVAQREQLQAAFGDTIQEHRADAGDRPATGIATIQRQDPVGKGVVDELTSPSWEPAGTRVDSPVSRPITGAELHVLLRGAAIAAWNTYAFHATKSANVASIMTQGLDPRRGGTGAAAGTAAFEAHSRGHVHYTRSRGLAEDYQQHFQGGTPFRRHDPSPAPAEILQVAVPRDLVDREERDPDSQLSDRAVRTTAAVPGRFMRSTKPVPLPPERDAKGKGRKRQAEPLEPGANAGAWLDHLDRTFAETGALLSNMPTSATSVLYDVMKRGLDVNTVLHMLNQGLRSMSINAILEFTQEDRAANPRVNQGQMDATGVLIPLRPPRREEG